MLLIIPASCWVKSAGKRAFANGTQDKPGISFRNDTNLGLRRNTEDKLSIVTNGSDRVTVDASGNVGISCGPRRKLAR